MKNIFSIFLGLLAIGYLIYVGAQVIQLAFGGTDGSWSDLSPHIIAGSILIILMIIGYFWGDKEETESAQTSTSTSPRETTAQATAKPSYNPLVDKLEFTVYQQSFETWWSDDYGDKQHHSTIYANLRFYEDGAVIGIRSTAMPKREVEDSFSMEGKWTAETNNISLTLEKVREVDDTINISLTEADRREMKYAGQIADDNSLIKAGTFKGSIQAGTLNIGNHTFTKLPLSKLILTAEEKTCEKIEAAFSHHPDVVYTFQNTGNWYTNGETGPEWFTVSIGTPSKNQEKITELVKEELIELDKGGNFFWDKG